MEASVVCFRKGKNNQHAVLAYIPFRGLFFVRFHVKTAKIVLSFSCSVI